MRRMYVSATMSNVIDPAPGVMIGQMCHVAQIAPTTTLATSAVYLRCSRGSAKPRQPTSSPNEPATSAPNNNPSSAPPGTLSHGDGAAPPNTTCMPDASRSRTIGPPTATAYQIGAT